MELIRRFSLPFWLGTGALGMLGIAVWFLPTDPVSRARIAGLLPALPGLIAFAAVLIAQPPMDEMERRIHFAAMSFEFASGILILLGLGILPVLLAWPPLNWALAAAVMSCAWAIGLLAAWRRYR